MRKGYAANVRRIMDRPAVDGGVFVGDTNLPRSGYRSIRSGASPTAQLSSAPAPHDAALGAHQANAAQLRRAASNGTQLGDVLGAGAPSLPTVSTGEAGCAALARCAVDARWLPRRRSTLSRSGCACSA